MQLELEVLQFNPPLDTWLRLGGQPYYKGPSDLWVKTVQTQWLTSVNEAVPSRLTQSWLWDSQLAVKKYRPWVASVRSVFWNANNYFIFKRFPGTVIYFSWKNTWGWKILELVLLDSCNLVLVSSKGFNNMQFKRSTCKKL